MRSERAEVRSEKAEVRSEKAEVRSEKAEVKQLLTDLLIDDYNKKLTKG